MSPFNGACEVSKLSHEVVKRKCSGIKRKDLQKMVAIAMWTPKHLVDLVVPMALVVPSL